jgi:hypothetical protein
MLIGKSKELEYLAGRNSLPEGLENPIAHRKFLNSPTRKKARITFQIKSIKILFNIKSVYDRIKLRKKQKIVYKN